MRVFYDYSGDVEPNRFLDSEESILLHLPPESLDDATDDRWAIEDQS